MLVNGRAHASMGVQEMLDPAVPSGLFPAFQPHTSVNSRKMKPLTLLRDGVLSQVLTVQLSRRVYAICQL